MTAFGADWRSIRTKIFTISLLPVMALILVAVINYRHLSDLGQSAEQIMARNYRSIKAAQEAANILETNRNILLSQFFGEGNPNQTTHSSRDLGRALETCRLHIAERGEKRLVEDLWYQYQKYNEIIARYDTDDLPSYVGEFTSLTSEMVIRLNDLVELNERGMELAEQQTRQLAKRAQRQSLVILLLAIGLILLLSFLLSGRIARPIRNLTDQLVANHKRGGRYPFLPVRGEDEIGLMTAEFNRLFESLSRYDQHNAAILAVEKDKVRQAEEARTRFIADLSHQLKTPMTSLTMSVNLLHDRRDRLTGEQISMLLDTATDDCERMAKLLNELVDIARLEAMVRPAVREPIMVTELIHTSLRPLVKQAEEKGVSLVLEIEPDLPVITLDTTRFPWILTNLVGNGLRYTDSGGVITIAVTRQSGSFVFVCRDNGCGIDPDHLPHIFERYSQFAEREKMGTIGLGLAIVKEIIEQHGGGIQAESLPGQGTVFTFWIPEHKDSSNAESIID
ncbi:sensor histidine kinase [Desulfopila aestuarii]|uniref:histidine kinase n=1 Tax=Desulfopila aestuarii DSM 18488 TaxID=1121416 RepID=A0A1M7XVT8_9BACT|nr:HAMP domain-containing sensor histidine kinase [Desulfopila aestuarii]SHO42796.1 HAMP domain-containing protein [Desulfopila aestuarii DSM 18488]